MIFPATETPQQRVTISHWFLCWRSLFINDFPCDTNNTVDSHHSPLLLTSSSVMIMILSWHVQREHTCPQTTQTVKRLTWPWHRLTHMRTHTHKHTHIHTNTHTHTNKQHTHTHTHTQSVLCKNTNTCFWVGFARPYSKAHILIKLQCSAVSISELCIHFPSSTSCAGKWHLLTFSPAMTKKKLSALFPIRLASNANS